MAIAPVNYISKSTIEEFKELNLTIIPYKVRGQYLPEVVGSIRKQLHNNQSSIIDNESLANIVSMINVRLADKGLFSKIDRNFSALPLVQTKVATINTCRNFSTCPTFTKDVDFSTLRPSNSGVNTLRIRKDLHESVSNYLSISSLKKEG